MMGRRGLALVAACAVLYAIPSPAAAQEPAHPFYGVNVNRVFNDRFDGAFWDLHLDAVQSSGIRLARSDAFWEAAEPSPPDSDGNHTYDWTLLDYYAVALATHELEWLAILDYSTPWSTTVPGEVHAPPASDADYAAYAAAFARRYGRGGTLWDEDWAPEYRPVRTYEVWNEPNLTHFWQPAPDAARYAGMYVAARAAIRGEDPAARVLVGGLAAPASDFVRAMYAARPELRDLVDGVALHPYSPTAEGVLAEVRALRGTLDELGEGHVPIVITEVGWQTSGLGSPLVVSEEQRAANLARVADAIARSDCGVSAFVPYTWTTPESNPDDGEDWYGMYRPSGGSTATSDAYARAVDSNAAAAPHAERNGLCHGPDTDGDGVPDHEDGDDDGDGVPDSEDAFPLDRRESADLDLDGAGDLGDVDDDGDGVEDGADLFPRDGTEWADADLDGLGDNRDADDDRDRVPDLVEAARGTSPTDADSDDDGLADGRERATDPRRPDSDRDRLPDGLERGRVTGVADPPGAALGTDPRRFRPDRHPGTRTLATRRDTDRDGLADGREDRNRNGRRDRSETDPLRADRG